MGRFIDVKLKPGHIPKGRLAFTLIVFCLLAVSMIRFYGGTEEVREVQLNLNKMTSSASQSISWFAPRNGDVIQVQSNLENTFTPPSSWEDAILIIEHQFSVH